MLYSILKECDLTTRSGLKVGKVVDLLVDTSVTPWTVKKITFKTRLLGRKDSALPIDRVEVDKSERNLSVAGYVQPEPSPERSEVDMRFLSDLTKKDAVSEDGENLGYIYDFDVATLTKPWTVEKVMIRTGTRKRRLKISVDRVKQTENSVTISAK